MVFHPIRFLQFKMRESLDYRRNVVEGELAAVGEFAATNEFEERFGVQTHKAVRIYHMNVVGKRLLDANHYRASHSIGAYRAITNLLIGRECYSFVNLGIGKGRMLIIAVPCSPQSAHN